MFGEVICDHMLSDKVTPLLRTLGALRHMHVNMFRHAHCHTHSCGGICPGTLQPCLVAVSSPTEVNKPVTAHPGRLPT